MGLYPLDYLVISSLSAFKGQLFATVKVKNRLSVRVMISLLVVTS